MCACVPPTTCISEQLTRNAHRAIFGVGCGLTAHLLRLPPVLCTRSLSPTQRLATAARGCAALLLERSAQRCLGGRGGCVAFGGGVCLARGFRAADSGGAAAQLCLPALSGGFQAFRKGSSVSMVVCMHRAKVGAGKV